MTSRAELLYLSPMLLRLASPRFLLLGAALACGCGSGDATDGGVDARVDASVTDIAAPFLDVDPSAQCASQGTGRLRVTVSLDPSFDLQTAEVWLGLRCGSHPISRVVRWDRSATQVIDGLGPGSYRVYGSSFLAPGAWSSAVLLGNAVTAAVPVTLQAEGEVLVSYSSTRGGPDASVDAATAGGAWQRQVVIRERGSGVMLGTATIEARPITLDPVGPDAGALPGLSVNVTVANTCATPPCAPLRPVAAEVRALVGETPVGVGMERFTTHALEAGTHAALAEPVVLRAMPPGGESALQVVIYGERTDATGPRG